MTALSRWTGVTAGDALIERITEVRRLRQRHVWASRYLALLLLGGGVVLVAVAVSRPRTPP